MQPICLTLCGAYARSCDTRKWTLDWLACSMKGRGASMPFLTGACCHVSAYKVMDAEIVDAWNSGSCTYGLHLIVWSQELYAHKTGLST